MRKWFEYLSIFLLCLATIFLIGLENKSVGWVLLIIGIATLPFSSRSFLKDLILLYGAIAVLGITSISPDISWGHIISMGAAIFSVVFIPYVISRYLFKDRHITFKMNYGKKWTKFQYFYLLLVIFGSYLVLPFYFKNSGAYLNWNFEPTFDSIARFFIGINVVGIWDELFFVNVTLGILKKYLPFYLANLAQAVIFSAVLYEFGFIGYGFLLIFIFALTQGYVFKKTESLFYIIVVHLTLDLILFLALLNAHHPDWIPIFITSGI